MKNPGGCDREAYPTPLAISITPIRVPKTNHRIRGGKKISDPRRIPVIGNSAAFH